MTPQEKIIKIYQEKTAKIYDDGFKNGAASRDAEVARLLDDVMLLRECFTRIMRQQETIGQAGSSAWTTAEQALSATEPHDRS